MSAADASTASALKPKKVKPRLRGVSHLVAFLLSPIVLATVLLTDAAALVKTGALIHSASLMLLFGMSALYHVPMWSPEARRRLRRFDHASIFFLISGTYTALWVLAKDAAQWQLIGMWVGAAVGVVAMVAWTDMPRGLRSGIYVTLGLAAAPLFLSLPNVIGWTGVVGLMIGAALYIVGSIVYALRRPNPDPTFFGYHEVFHLMVVLAAAIHVLVVSAARVSLS